MIEPRAGCKCSRTSYNCPYVRYSQRRALSRSTARATSSASVADGPRSANSDNSRNASSVPQASNAATARTVRNSSPFGRRDDGCIAASRFSIQVLAGRDVLCRAKPPTVSRARSAVPRRSRCRSGIRSGCRPARPRTRDYGSGSRSVTPTPTGEIEPPAPARVAGA